MEFQTLLEELPDCPGAGTLSLGQKGSGFRYIDDRLPEFVGPDLAPSESIDQPITPKILIVSAAGAVGKSTLAKEVAFHKKAPIWDLAQAPAVGGKSMSGQLTASFGFSQAADVSKRLAEGSLFLVVDALDEARVKANEAGFEAFVEDIAEIAAAASSTAVVLFGRTQTAETTYLLLELLGVPTSVLSIQPFTRPQAESYIEARIQHFDAAAAKRIAAHRQPYVEARDLILNHLEQAVGGVDALKDAAVREFLGYAPVLETVAVLLAKEGNYQDLISSLSGSMQANSSQSVDRPLAVLDHVVTRLLQREQTEKLQSNIRPALESVAADAGWSEWDILYAPEEQRLRLLNKILSCTLDPCPEMPGSVRAKYEEQLNAWLPEHPFLRDGAHPANKVFESYLFATAMREHRTPLSRIVEDHVSASEYKPSRLLADFYMLLGEQLGNEVVPERHIGLLYDSLLAGETDSLRVRLSVESGDPDETEDQEFAAEGEFELVYLTPESTDLDQVAVRSFRITDQDDQIAFGRQLKEATIITKGSVSLGGEADDFEIGPAVDLRCGKLLIRSAGIVIRARRNNASSVDGVHLDAACCDANLSKKPLVRGSLSVSWPGAEAYPWSDFAVQSSTEAIADEAMHEVHRRFRRIVMSLRSHSKGSLARIKDKVEHRRVLQNEVGDALLKKLLDDGILRIQGKFYHWMPDRAGQILKVSYDDLRHRRVTSELEAYLGSFIQDHKELFS